ncbi:MAG: nuclear transport factor 2 family protein [Dermatophilaceae bacterium]
MSTDTCDEIGLARAENRLQDAVRAADVQALDDLLHDRLIATGPDGRLVTKREDLGGYASGTFRVRTFDELARTLLVVGSTGVSIILAAITGRAQGSDFEVRMRYTRTWTYAGRWQVLSAHLSLVEPPV